MNKQQLQLQYEVATAALLVLLLRLQVVVLGLGIEAGTGLADVGEVAMAEDAGIGVVGLERLQQVPEGGFLCRCTGVAGVAFRGETSLIADAKGVLVVVAGMGAGEILMTSLIDMAIASDVVMVTGEPEAGIMAGYEVLD
jgi:hypothetical protein